MNMSLVTLVLNSGSLTVSCGRVNMAVAKKTTMPNESRGLDAVVVLALAAIARKLRGN